jgi:hypothetical protein
VYTAGTKTSTREAIADFVWFTKPSVTCPHGHTTQNTTYIEIDQIL